MNRPKNHFQQKFSQICQIIKELALNDFRIRYQGSILGFLWTLIKPLLLFSVLYIVFSTFMRFEQPHYQLYLLLGIILWNFFAETTSITLQSLLSKSHIITKLYIPKWTIIVASVANNALTLFLNLLIFAVFILYSPVTITLNSLILFPLLILQLILLSLAASFVLSILFVFFRDINHIWEVLLQIGFWITPIIYPISIVPDSNHYLFNYNPIFHIIDASRDLFINHQLPNLAHQLLLTLFLLIFLGLSIIFFDSQQKKIAELI